MTTALARALTINDANIWKGAARMMTSVSTWATLFPTYDAVTDPPLLEDIVHMRSFPAYTVPIVQYTLAVGWADLGALTEDGVTITREWDESDGITIDQRDTPLRGGIPQNVRMSVSATSVYNSLDMLDYFWQTGSTGTVPTAPGAAPAAEGNVAQRNLTIGETKTLAEKRVAIVQQSDTPTSGVSPIYKVHGFLFRAGVLNPPSAIKWSSRAHTTQDFALRIRSDVSVSDGTEFGWFLEQTGT